MKNDNLAESLWFTARWVTGYFVDFVITVGSVAAMLWSMSFYLKNPLHDLPLISDSVLSHPLTAFGVGVGVFAAFMSGRQWVRTQYFHHILPEVWQDAVKSFVESANKDKK